MRIITMLAQKEAKQVSSSDCSAKDVKGSVSMKPCHYHTVSPLVPSRSTPTTPHIARSKTRQKFLKKNCTTNKRICRLPFWGKTRGGSERSGEDGQDNRFDHFHHWHHRCQCHVIMFYHYHYQDNRCRRHRPFSLLQL